MFELCGVREMEMFAMVVASEVVRCQAGIMDAIANATAGSADRLVTKSIMAALCVGFLKEPLGN